MKKFLLVIISLFIIDGCMSIHIATHIKGTGVCIGGAIDAPGDDKVFIGRINSTNPTLSELSISGSPFTDSKANVNLILNTFDSNSYHIRELSMVKIPRSISAQSGVIQLNGPVDYISLKWNDSEGGWFLWRVTNYNEFSFSGLKCRLFHFKTWTSSPIQSE